MNLKNFFKGTPAWRDSNPGVRLAAIGKVDDQDLLQQIFATDSAPEVRLAALERITSAERLIDILKKEKDLRAQATAKFTLLIEQSDDALALLDTLGDPQLLEQIALTTRKSVIAKRYLLDQTDERTVVELACQARTAEIRQLAAQRVTSADGLALLKSRTRGKDKVIHNTARDRLREIAEQEKARVKLFDSARHYGEQMAVLTRKAADPQFSRTFHLLEQQWANIDDALSAYSDQAGELAQIRQVYAEAAQSCRTQLETFEHARRELEKSEKTRNAIITSLGVVESRLQQTVPDVDEDTQQRDQLQQSWMALSEFPADAKSLKIYHKRLLNVDKILDAHRRWNGLLQQLNAAMDQTDTAGLKRLYKQVANFHWPQDCLAGNDFAVWLSRIQAQNQERKQSRESEALKRQQFDSTLTELERCVDAGQTRNATKLRNKLRDLANKSSLDVHQSERFALLSKKLQDLSDWQKFATHPKRLELCENMETLILESLAPDLKAERIAGLHAAWKELGDSHQDQSLWHRFQRASETAYEPCKVFFSEQKRIKEEHFATCKKMCQDLETYAENYDWGHADWKAVRDLITTARSQWRDLGQLDRGNQRRLQDRFGRVMDILNDHLTSEQDRNAERKLNLINQLQEGLAAELDTDNLVNLAKGLQAEWKSIVIMDRRVDQTLWKQFRELCEDVFTKRDSRKEEQKRNAQDRYNQANTHIDSLLQLTKNLDPASPLNEGTLIKLREETLEISLEPADHARILKRLDHAGSEYRKAMEDQARITKLDELGELRRRSELCTQLETHILSGGSHVTDELLHEWEISASIDRELQQRIELRWAASINAAASGIDTNILDENLYLARTICTRLELLIGRETPPGDQQLRMQLQVEKLNGAWSGNRQDRDSENIEIHNLVIDWYCLGPLPPMARPALEERFRLCVDGRI